MQRDEQRQLRSALDRYPEAFYNKLSASFHRILQTSEDLDVFAVSGQGYDSLFGLGCLTNYHTCLLYTSPSPRD